MLTLNRPERKNALSPALLHALRDALRQPAQVFVITGAGSVFCAGGDLGPSEDDGFLGQHDARRAFADLLLQISRSRVPIVAAVNGDALGGGFGLAAACHLLVADERARFATPELKLGLFPWMIGPVLMRALPQKVVHDCVLTGRRLSAAETQGYGLVARVCPPGEVREAALALASEVGAWSPAVTGLGLESLARTADLPLEAALAYMHGQLSINLMMEDAGEGVSAFLSRRAPVWKGR